MLASDNRGDSKRTVGLCQGVKPRNRTAQSAIQSNKIGRAESLQSAMIRTPLVIFGPKFVIIVFINNLGFPLVHPVDDRSHADRTQRCCPAGYSGVNVERRVGRDNHSEP